MRFLSGLEMYLQSDVSVEHELGYCQQIARQLRTQYAEGIYRHKYYIVTLKSRLRVTGNGTIG